MAQLERPARVIADYDLAKIADPSFLEARTARLHYSLHVMAKTVDRLLADSLPFAGLRSLGRIETPLVFAGLCALLFFAGRRAPAVAAAVGLWLVLATPAWRPSTGSETRRSSPM